VDREQLVSWRGFGPEWNEVLAGLGIVGLVLTLILAHLWLVLILVLGLVLGLVAAAKL
jgi:hypothetical protein